MYPALLSIPQLYIPSPSSTESSTVWCTYTYRWSLLLASTSLALFDLVFLDSCLFFLALFLSLSSLLRPSSDPLNQSWFFFLFGLHTISFGCIKSSCIKCCSPQSLPAFWDANFASMLCNGFILLYFQLFPHLFITEFIYIEVFRWSCHSFHDLFPLCEYYPWAHHVMISNTVCTFHSFGVQHVTLIFLSRNYVVQEVLVLGPLLYPHT